MLAAEIMAIQTEMALIAWNFTILWLKTWNFKVYGHAVR